MEDDDYDEDENSRKDDRKMKRKFAKYAMEYSKKAKCHKSKFVLKNLKLLAFPICTKKQKKAQFPGGKYFMGKQTD